MQKSRTYFYTLLLLGVVSVFQSCKLADIRTTEVKESFDSKKGLDILNQMSKAHSLEKWDSISLYSLHLKDEFYGLMGKFGNPFPNNVGEFDLSLIPNTFTSQATFTDEKWEGNIWGIQSWKTYSNLKSDSLKFHTENDKNIEFWLPTYQYFIEIANRIFEADKISYAGEKSYKGKVYDLVFASWKSDIPQKNIDQYLLWIEKETKILGLIQYTVRDQYKWLNATLVYDSYNSLHGVLIPEKMSVSLSSPSKKKIMHQITISNIVINDKKNILINPNIGTTGKNN